MSQPILILGGTAEARQLAHELCTLGFSVITSLAGRTAEPMALAGARRMGGFGGVEGFVRYLQKEEIALVVDATHPFAAQISWQTAIATQQCGVPWVMLVRPAWVPEPGDRWWQVASLAAAAERLPQISQRVFLAIGRQEVAQFAQLTDLWFLMRFLEPPRPEDRLPAGEVVCDRPPYSVDHEQALLIHHRIDTLVSKNSGGEATYAKIQAARRLEIPVLLVERPPLPEGERVATVAEAVQWVQTRMSF